MQTIRQGMFVMKTACGTCGGEGEKVRQACGQCKGSGVEKKRVTESIDIPRGMKDGMTMKMPGKGNFGGDLMVKVSVRKSKIFDREGNDALSEL